MNIELRSLKHFAAGSQETHCFVATLYVDGQKFATVENDGHGGADNMRPIGNRTYQDVEELEKRIAAEYPPMRGGHHGIPEDWTHPYSLESLVCELINVELSTKDLRRKLKSHILAFNPEDREIYQWSRRKYKDVPEEKLVASVAKHNPGFQILNSMPFDDALKLWRGK